MYTTIIVFYISLFAIIAMLFMKHTEIKNNKKSIVSRLGEGSDYVVRSVYQSIRYVLSHVNAHNGIVALQWIAFHILSSARAFYIRLQELAHNHPHSKKVIDMIHGRGEINQNGGASFYLKRIGEEVKK